MQHLFIIAKKGVLVWKSQFLSKIQFFECYHPRPGVVLARRASMALLPFPGSERENGADFSANFTRTHQISKGIREQPHIHSGGHWWAEGSYCNQFYSEPKTTALKNWIGTFLLWWAHHILKMFKLCFKHETC